MRQVALDGHLAAHMVRVGLLSFALDVE